MQGRERATYLGALGPGPLNTTAKEAVMTTTDHLSIDQFPNQLRAVDLRRHRRHGQCAVIP